VGSYSQVWVGLERATTLAPRILIARVQAIETFRYPGSTEVAPQEEGKGLPFLRVEILRTLKGKPVDGEVRVFDPRHWYHHLHAELIRAGVISFGESFYQSRLPLEEIGPGRDVLFFLTDEAMPPAFPPDSVFMRLCAGFESVSREEEVKAALQNGPYGDFNTLIDLKPEGSLRFPEGLEVRHLGGGHKRPMNDGPQCEFIELGLNWGKESGILRLNHVTQPNGEQSWDFLDWQRFQILLRGIASDGSCTIVVANRLIYP
jgi:hypothetical protein